jgi:hypothetical protein
MRPKHQRFVEEYAKDWNAAAAYHRAGYHARGNSAAVNAYRLQQRPDVAEAIAAASLAQDVDWIRAEEQRLGRPIIRVRIPGVGIFNRRTGHFEPPLRAPASRLRPFLTRRHAQTGSGSLHTG